MKIDRRILILAFFMLNTMAIRAYELLDSAVYKACPTVCDFAENRGKTVGVFGGSFACINESETAKNLWREYLGMQVTTYAKSGAGFCVPNNMFKTQIQQAGIHDIYILWCSSNDSSRETPIETQNAAIVEAIDMLRQKNPQAKIYLFSMMKAYSKAAWVQTVDIYKNAQISTAQSCGVPYVDLCDLPFTGSENAAVLCQKDKVHPSSDGYYNFGWNMLYLLATDHNFDYDAPLNFHDGISIITEKLTEKKFVIFPKRLLDMRDISEYEEKYGAEELVNLTVEVSKCENGGEFYEKLKNYVKISKKCQEVLSSF